MSDQSLLDPLALIPHINHLGTNLWNLSLLNPYMQGVSKVGSKVALLLGISNSQ